MTDTNDQIPRIKCALFVDFDNVYLGLKTLDPAAAERFATEPAQWLQWIEQGMPTDEENGAQVLDKRKVLIRRCYLNPRSFSQFRPYFTRSAFVTVDCPPVTAQGKNSADIHMVMDVLDTLEHKTRFDEFIILSNDSDFAPVLMRLRAHDRRTVVFTIGPAAEAYKASCDRVVTEEAFIEDALKILPTKATRAKSTKREPAKPPAAAATAGDTSNEVVAHLQKLLAAASGPISMTRADHELRRALGRKVAQTRWFGAGSLRAFLQSVAVPGIAMTTDQQPGYVYDPARHQPPTVASTEDKFEKLRPDLVAFARRVSQVTGAPLLTPSEYVLVAEAAAEELKAHRFHITGTSKGVRDRCFARGSSISRRNVISILDGIKYAGYRFSQPTTTDTALELRRAYRNSVIKLCSDAQLELADDEKKLLDEWIVGAHEPEAAPASTETAVAPVEQAPPETAVPVALKEEPVAKKRPVRTTKPGSRTRQSQAETLIAEMIRAGEAAAKAQQSRPADDPPVVSVEPAKTVRSRAAHGEPRKSSGRIVARKRQPANRKPRTASQNT